MSGHFGKLCIKVLNIKLYFGNFILCAGIEMIILSAVPEWCIQNHVKHPRWSVLQKLLTALNR